MNQSRASSGPAVQVQIAAEYTRKVNIDDLRAAARAVLIAEDHAEGQMTLVVTVDDHVRELNARYLGTDSVTDVLAFPSRGAKGKFVEPEDAPNYLGDVIIAYPQAKAQAEAEGHPVSEELQLLVVHGTLHLVGYDHATAQDEKAMWERQNQILNYLRGLDELPPPVRRLAPVPGQSPWRTGLWRSFLNAFAGLSYFLVTQRNARIEVAIAALAVAVAAWLRVTLLEWAVLALTIGLVLVAEMFNSVLETAVDAATQEYHPVAKCAKDVAAGAVVFSAMVSIAVGFLLFGPRLWAWLQTIR